MNLSSHTITDDWHHVKLKEICIDNQQGFASGKRDNNGIKQLRMNNVTNDGRFILDTYIRVPVPPYITRYDLKKGDILFNNTNSVDLVGKTAVVNDDVVDFTFSNHFNRIRVDTTKVLPEWVRYSFEIKWQQGYFKRVCRRHVHQAGIGRGEIEAISLSFPSLPEQNKIITFISSLEKAIQKSDEIITKTEKIKKGLTREFLTKGIGHKNFKDTEIGRIPKEWKIYKLSDACIEVIIGVVNPATPYYTKDNNGIPYFRSQNVREAELTPTKISVIKEFNEKHPKSILRENDVLTLQTGFIGTSCLVPKKYQGANCHSLLISRTNNEILLPELLCYWLNSSLGKNIIKRHNSGWGRDHLLLQDFREIKIPCPPLYEQQKIIEILSSVGKKFKLEKNRKEKFEKIKKGLMNDLLTGNKRLKITR